MMFPSLTGPCGLTAAVTRSTAARSRNKEAYNARLRERRAADPEKFRAKSRAWYAEHKEERIAARRVNHLAEKYGLTPLQVEKMIRKQKGKCAICKQPPTGRWKTLHVDHDHETGKVRGMLCYRCNLALGQFKDSLDLVKSAAAYLARHGKTC